MTSKNEDLSNTTSNDVSNQKNILQDFDEDMFKKEYSRLYSAISNEELSLKPEDKIKLINDLELITKSFNFDLNEHKNLDKLYCVEEDDVTLTSSEVVPEFSDERIDFGDSEGVSTFSDDEIDLGFLGDEIDLGFLGDSTGLNESENEFPLDIGTLNNENDEIAIKVNNVTMEYKISKDKIDTLKEFVIRTIKNNKTKSNKLTALKNVSFEIPKGDRVGIIGFNGAGKSTLLKVLSKVYEPTYGSVEIKGKLAPLLELGAGFDPNYSGKANIYLNGAFLGFSEDFLKEKYDEIVDFSELGESINFPVKNYSTGMRAKLGFAIATIVNPDILIIDEILSVGDIKFQKKSAEKLRSLIDSGITVLLVSHSVNQIRDICNKAIWIDSGEIKMMGEVNKVCDEYVKAAKNASNNQLKNIKLG